MAAYFNKTPCSKNKSGLASVNMRLFFVTYLVHAAELFRTCWRVALFLLVVTGSTFAADKSAGDAAVIDRAALSCFSVTPPKSGQESCDQVCSGKDKDAACVGLVAHGGTSPGIDCDSIIINPRNIQSCRCCVVAH
jgi:hypothetical protein